LGVSFWNGRRVLVTGHTGFKGSWLSLWLAELGAKVTGYALAPPTTPSLFEQANTASRMQSITADIKDAARVAAVTHEAAPEVIFHLAAQSLVRTSYAEPLDTFATNIMGTAHVLEAARHVSSVRAVVIVTTDKCYENREWAWGYREDDTLGGHDPYSSSKACAELVTSAYRRSFFNDGRIGIASARAGNVIGGGDWAKDRIVPDIVRATLAGQPVVVRNPLSTRPWQHVLDVVGGYLVLAERLHDEPAAYSTAWNFGPSASDVRTVGELARVMCARWGDGARWTHEPTVQPHEARALTLDSTNARVKLGWAPRLDFESAIRWSVDWYRAARDHEAVTLDQVRRFRELVA
jgi:CDP-glucose 4,6-dehydratase